MARSTPSLLALLGVAAMAGYQNRDKLGQMLGGGQGSPATGHQPAGGLGGLLGALGGGGLAGGIGELIERFGAAGQRDKAESWVAHGQNQPIDRTTLERSLDRDTLDELARTTGLSHDDILQRLSQNLPDTIDRLTPQGRLPTEDEARGLI